MTLHPAAAAMLATAARYVGEMEQPANSNYHPTVSWYRQNVDDIGTHWNYCAAGVTREFHNSGAKAILRPRAYVPWMMQDFLDGFGGGSLLWVDSSVRAAQRGDVVFFDWSKPADGRRSVWTGNHVGVVKTIIDGDTVRTIEHNTSVPGTGNEGTTEKLRDAKYIVAFGRPGWDRLGTVTVPKIPGTSLPLLDVDGDLGPATVFALGTVLNARGWPVIPAQTVRADLVRAVQSELRKHGKLDREGKPITVDGRGFGSNSSGRYPAEGWTRTISALQIGHGVSRADADGVFDAHDSSEVRRIQADVNRGGASDSPLFTG